MIQVYKEPLPEGAAEALRAWLQKKEFHTLCRVIEARENFHSVAMVNKAIESKTHELKMAEANDNLRNAQRYAITLEILKEIAAEKESFSIVKLT